MSVISKFTRQEISKLFASARRVLRNKSLDILLSAPSQTTIDNHSDKNVTGRILVVTPRRTGNAPQRNKVRRRLKALYHETALYKKGYDCVVIVKRDGINTSFQELKVLLEKAYEYCPKNNH